MTELDSVDRLLEQARVELAPSGADKLRTRAALGVPDAAPKAATRAAGRSAWHALRASGKAGLLAAVVLLGSGLGAGYWLGQRAPGSAEARTSELPAEGAARATTPPSSPLAPPTTPPSIAPQAPSAPAAEPSRPRLSRLSAVQATARPRTPMAAAPASDPVDELSLLRRSERALRGSDPALALGLLSELEERFPETTLHEEREAMLLMAHCGLDDVDAREHAQLFLRAHEASVYAERVRSACTRARVGRSETAEGSLPAGHQ